MKEEIVIWVKKESVVINDSALVAVPAVLLRRRQSTSHRLPALNPKLIMPGYQATSTASGAVRAAGLRNAGCSLTSSHWKKL